jgi:DNA-binding response OmpR family regulator
MGNLQLFKNYTLLYVEDEANIRETNKEFLKRRFKDVYEASNGKEGLLLFHKYRPDIILVDIKMPQLNGIDMVKEIRKVDKNTKIIIASAHTDVDYMLDAVELNITRYLVKPLTSKKLFAAFEKCLDEMKESDDGLVEISEACKFNKNTKELLIDGKIIKLKKKEIAFMELFTDNLNKIVSYQEIENYVWKDSSMSSSALRTQIKYLREKLPQDILKNVSGYGYQLITSKE